MFTALASRIHMTLAGYSSDSGFVVFIEIQKIGLTLGVCIIHGHVLCTGKYSIWISRLFELTFLVPVFYEYKLVTFKICVKLPFLQTMH